MIWSCTDWGVGDGDADGVGDAAAEPEGVGDAGAADVAGEPDTAGAAEAAGLDTGVGVGVPTMGWPVTSDADEVRITALATTAETNPMIRPTR